MLEIKSYDDWSEETDELGDAPENRIKKYTDYVRSSYYKAGQLTKEVDDEIVAGVRDRLYSDGLLTEESGEEEVNSKLGSIAGTISDKDTDARFVLEHLKANSTPQSQDPRTQALTNYLALKNINPSQAEQFRTTVDEVTSDRKLVREARISAADRGDYSVVAVDEDDGKRTFYTGPTAKPDKLSGEIDTLIKAGAISTSDLYAVNDVVKPINGGLSTTSENARYEMFRRAVGEKAKQDKDLNDLLAGQASARKQEITESQQTLGEDILQGAKTVVAYPFERLAEGIMGVGRFLTGEEKPEPKYSLDTKLSDVLGGDENLRRRFSAEEIEKFSDALVTTAAGPVYRADRPETGISMDSMGNPLIASALLPNDEKFEAALTAAPLNKEQQSMARVQRDALLKSSTPDLLKIILDEEPDAASALAKFKADGKSDTDFVKSWVSDPNNYSGFETRLEQFGKGALKTIAEIPLGIAALAGNEWAVNEMGKMMDDQARRREYSRLFGDEYGLGFEIINTIPQVATDIGLTIGTGGVFAGAKTLAKAGAATGRTTLRTAAKIGLSTADDIAANAFKTAITAGGEETTGIAIKEMGRSLGAQFAENAPVFTTSFVRSASSTYASIYNQLPDDMSHEEKHKNSLGYAIAAGLSTGVITTGMSFIGHGGVEDLATNRIRAMLGGETDEAVAAAGGKFIPVDKLNFRQAKAVYENLKTESAPVTDVAFRQALRGAIGSTYKNYLKTTLGGALSESVEEALDQAIQMKLEDASLNRDTPLVEQVNQIFTAGVIGGALGGLTSGSSQFGQVKQSELASVFEARASALENVAKRLRETNSSATAETVQRLIDDARAKAAETNKLDAQARSEAEALKQKTIYSDPNERQLESTEAELTMLGDLVGERVSAAGFYGTVEVDDNGSAHLVTKSGEVVHLGSKYEKAAGRVSSYPQLMATATQVGSVPAGTPYISRGKKDTTKIAMPAVSELNKPEDFLGVIKNEEGNIIQLVVKNAKLMSDQEFGIDIKIGNRYQMNSLARYYNVDLNSLQDLTPVAETEETANPNDIDNVGDSAVSQIAKDTVLTAKSILQQGPYAAMYKAFMAGDPSKTTFKQKVLKLSEEELDHVSQVSSNFYDWVTSDETIAPEVRTQLIQSAEDLKARVGRAAQIRVEAASKLEASQWDVISDEEKALINEELQDEQDALEAELNAAAAGQTPTLSDKDKAATQAALVAAQKKLGIGVSEAPQVTTKSGEAEGNEVIEGEDPQKILSNLIQRLRAVNDEVPIIVESAEGFISPAAANRQTKQLKAAIQQATENEDTEQLKLLSDQLGKITTRVYTMKEAEQIKTNLKFLAGFYKTPEFIAEVSERLGRLESAMSAGNRILSSRKSRLRQQIAGMIPQDEEATTLTSDEQQLADLVSRIEGTRPPKPEVLPKPKKIKQPAGEDWSTEDKLHLFKNEADERAFNSLVDDGIIISDLSEWGATISSKEQELLGFEGPQLFTKTRYLGDPTNPNKYIRGKHILLARKVLERFPLVEPPADATTIKSKNNYTDPVAGKRGKIDLPVYRDKAQFVSEGVFTNDPRISREFINMNIPVVIPPELIKKHKNPKDPFFINKSIDFDEDSGVVLSVLDPITREPKIFSGEETMVSNEGYLPYRTSRITNLLVRIIPPNPQYLRALGATVSGIYSLPKVSRKADNQFWKPPTKESEERQPMYGRGLTADQYITDFRRYLFEGTTSDTNSPLVEVDEDTEEGTTFFRTKQIGGIESSRGYKQLKDDYMLSDESIASASTAAISEYTLGIYEYGMGQALRSYVSKAMLFAKNKGMDAVVKQALEDARAEYGDTLSKEELEQIPDSYFLKYIKPDKKALKDLDPVRVVSQFFYSNNKDAIAESIVSMYPQFHSSSAEAVIGKYAAFLFDRVSDPKGNLYTGPKQPRAILDQYGDLYQRAEIRRRKYTSFGGIGKENAGILDRLVTSGEARSSTAARGVDDLAVDPLFVRSYDEVSGDTEATYAYKDSLRTSLIKTVNSEPELQSALQDIAGSFDGSLVELEGEFLVDLLTNVVANAGDRKISQAVTNRLYAMQNIAGLRAAGIMAELGWLPPVAGFKAVAPEVRASPELESPEASRERLLQIISAAKDASYRAADMATPEEEATYRARLTEAVQMAQPEIQQALSVANKFSNKAELRARYRESMGRLQEKLNEGPAAYASAVSGLRNDITKGQDRLVKLEELIANSDANISDVKLGLSKAGKDQEALRPKLNKLSKDLQSLVEKKNKGGTNLDARIEKASSAFEQVYRQMDVLNGVNSTYASNLKFFERGRNKLVNEQEALTKYLDRTTPIVTQLEGLTWDEAIEQIRASRRSADLDSGTYTKVSDSMKLKAGRIAREKAETIVDGETPLQKTVREAAAATAQLRYNSERSNLYKASNIATNAQLEAAARTANTRDIERYGINSNDRESMLGAFRAMTKSSVESHREVANLLLLAPDFIRSVRFGIVDVRSDWSGLYDSQTNTILLNVAGHNGRGLADVILHEYLHAATVTYFKNPRTAEQRAAVKRIGQIRQLAVAQATKKGLMKFAHVREGLANDAEFLTYTLTSPEFQASLSLLTPPNQSSILSRIIDAILSFFGKNNFKLQKAVRELLDFTQMGLVNFHTYNVSTKRDTNALIEKGQYIRTEMEDTIFLQELLDDVMSGNAAQDDTIFGDLPDRIFFSVSDVEKLNTPSGISLQSFAAAFTSRIKPETKKYEDVVQLADDIIYDHIRNPENYIVKATEDGISKMYKRLLTMPDGKLYDPDNIEHANASDQTIEMHNLISDGGFAEAVKDTVDKINFERSAAISSFANYLRNNTVEEADPAPLYDSPEAAVLLIAASKYAVRTEPDPKADNGLRYRVIEMTSDNEQMPFVADGKTASDMVDYLRSGSKIKDAVKLAYIKQQNAALETSKKFNTGWYVFKQSKEHEDAVKLNQACAGTSWCTGGSVSTAKGHLSGGDFHIYFEKGKPEVAIRTTNGRLAEPPRGNTPNQTRTQKHEDILQTYLTRSDTNITGAEGFLADKEFLDRVVKEKGLSSFTDLDLISIPQRRQSTNGYADDADKWPQSVYNAIIKEVEKRDNIFVYDADKVRSKDYRSDVQYIYSPYDPVVNSRKFPNLVATNANVWYAWSDTTDETIKNLEYVGGTLYVDLGNSDVKVPKLKRAEKITVRGDYDSGSSVVVFPELTSAQQIEIKVDDHLSEGGDQFTVEFPALTTLDALSVTSGNVKLPQLVKLFSISGAQYTKNRSVSIPRLTEVYHLYLPPQLDAPNLSKITYLSRATTPLSLPQLTEIVNWHQIKPDTYDFPRLTKVGDIDGVMDGNHVFPNITTINNIAAVTGNISLPNVLKMEGSISEIIGRLDMPKLTEVFDIHTISGFLNLPNLNTIYGKLSEIEMPVPLNLPKVKTIGRAISGTVSTIKLPELETLGDPTRVSFTGNAISNVSSGLIVPKLKTIYGSISTANYLELPSLESLFGKIKGVQKGLSKGAPSQAVPDNVRIPDTAQIIGGQTNPVPKRNGRDGWVNMIRVAERQGGAAIDVLGEIRRIVPAGINVEIDDTMVGAMGARRSKPNTIIVNSKLINDIGAGLSVANAKAAVRTAVDEELAHHASYTVFTERDFMDIANELGTEKLNDIAHIYYSNLEPNYNKRVARIASDRESGILNDTDLAAEYVRMEMTRMAVGRTREDRIAFLYTNPSLLSRWLEALKAFISRLKQRFSEAPTTGTAARISQASRAFRKLREGGVLPLPQEAAADELGDSVALLNALNGDIIEGQEDRTRYMVPIATSGNRQQVDAFWKRIEDKYYNFPLELRKLLALRDGTLSEVEYTMDNFSRMFPKLRDEALARGADIEDIGKVLGTTAPAIQRQARKAIRDQVKQFKINNATDPDLEVKAAEFERQITNTEANKFFAQFRQEQQQVESRLRASGFGELVDYLVEFRQEINKYKAVVNFDDSNDVYLTRSFRFFSSEGWALAAKAGGKVTIDGKEVDFDKLRAAALTHFEWEVDNAAKKNNEVLTKDQRDERLVMALDNYLKRIQLEAEESKELGPVRALRKDLNRMLTKQDFDSPLRKLLGEVEDPFENAVRTIYSVGRMAANERFLKDFANQAIAIGVADRKKGEGMELLFPPSQSAELGDLAGLYVDSKVAAAFREELGINMRRQDSRSAGMINNMGRWLSKFSGLTITAKTLGSVGFYPRNILGGIALTTAQGIVNPTNFAESSRLAIAASLPIKQADSQEMRDKLRRLVELQVLRDDTRGRIAMDMLKGFVASTDEQLEELMNEIIDAQATGNIDKIAKRFDGLQKFGVKTVDFLAGLNNVIDSAFKLNAYFYELDVLKEAYGNSEPESTLEAMAAQKVKRTFPTHSDQVSLAKSFGRSPYAMLVLPFVRWKSEVFRTMFNTIPLAVQEMRSGNDVLVRRGAKRLIGFTSTMLLGSSVYGGVFATLFGLLTDDEDDERAALRKLNEQEMEALRLALPEWQRNHGVFAQKLKDGSVQVIDNTNILPYSQLTDLVGLATRGDIKGIADYLTSEIIGTQIAASTAIELGQNRDDFGQPIWLQTDDGFTATVKILKHLGKGTLLPSVVDKAVKIGRYGEQNAKEMIVGELTGVRPIIHKQTDIEYRGMRNLKDSADAVVSLLYPLSGGKALDLDNVEGVIDDHQAASNTNQQKLHNFIVGMKSLGSTDESLANIAQQMKFSKQRFGAALDGVNIPWVPNKQWFQKMYDNKIRTGEQNPDEIAAKINEILSRKPDIYRVNEE